MLACLPRQCECILPNLPGGGLSAVKRTYILYGSDKQYSAGHKRVHSSGQPPYFVRMEVHPGTLDQALAEAKPIRGETVLNTIETDGLIESGKP